MSLKSNKKLPHDLEKPVTLKPNIYFYTGLSCIFLFLAFLIFQLPLPPNDIFFLIMSSILIAFFSLFGIIGILTVIFDKLIYLSLTKEGLLIGETFFKRMQYVGWKEIYDFHLLTNLPYDRIIITLKKNDSRPIELANTYHKDVRYLKARLELYRNLYSK